MKVMHVWVYTTSIGGFSAVLPYDLGVVTGWSSSHGEKSRTCPATSDLIEKINPKSSFAVDVSTPRDAFCRTVGYIQSESGDLVSVDTRQVSSPF